LVCSAFQYLYSSREYTVSEQAPSIYRRGRYEVGRFKGEERLVVGRHSTFLSREEYRVAAGILFYQAERQKYYIIRKGYTRYSKVYTSVFIILTI
jgi:hypothetical protein